MEFLVVMDIFLILLIELEIYSQGRFQKSLSSNWTSFSYRKYAFNTKYQIRSKTETAEKPFWLNCMSLEIGPAVRVFANGPGDLGSIPGRVIPKTLKMELDTTLLNTQHYKVRFKGKVEQSREWSSALPYTLV